MTNAICIGCYKGRSTLVSIRPKNDVRGRCKQTAENCTTKYKQTAENHKLNVNKQLKIVQ